MALTGAEHWERGFVMDASGNCVTTTDNSSQAIHGGFYRDPDGRLIVSGAYQTANPSLQPPQAIVDLFRRVQ